MSARPSSRRAGAAGIEAARLDPALDSEQVKQGLRAVTDEALALGVFGVPSVIVGGQLYWGDDGLERAAAAQRALPGA